MHKQLRVLVIEDLEDDAELMIHALRRGGFEFHHEGDTTEELQSALKSQTCDYKLPGLDGHQALATIISAQPYIAVIFVPENQGGDGCGADAIRREELRSQEQSDAPQLGNRA
jgi:CheY-like chemotaxis protein